MPPFMVRSSPSWIAIALLGSIMPAASADAPPCPSQIPPTAAPGGATAQFATSAPPRKKPLVLPKPGSAPLDVTSDGGVIELGNGKMTLKGNVVVRQGDRELRANQMQVDRNNQSVRSEGRVEYNDPLVHVIGASGNYSAASGGSFQSAQFELHQRSVRGSARNLQLTPQGTLRLQGVTFTTCPVHLDSWQLKASSIVLDTHAELGTAHDAAIDFQGVPLMYLPWASFPLSSERKSGFLFPSIGNTTTSGVQIGVPYYWNIAPNADFTFQPVEYSKRGPDLGGDLRFLTFDQRGELQWNYLPERPRVRRRPQPRAAERRGTAAGRISASPWMRRTSATRSTSRTSPRPRKAPAPRSSTAAPTSPTVTPTGAWTPQRSSTRRSMT